MFFALNYQFILPLSLDYLKNHCHLSIFGRVSRFFLLRETVVESDGVISDTRILVSPRGLRDFQV